MGILVSTVNYAIRKANKHISLLSTLLNLARDRLLLLSAGEHCSVGQRICRP